MASISKYWKAYYSRSVFCQMLPCSILIHFSLAFPYVAKAGALHTIAGVCVSKGPTGNHLSCKITSWLMTISVNIQVLFDCLVGGGPAWWQLACVLSHLSFPHFQHSPMYVGKTLGCYMNKMINRSY